MSADAPVLTRAERAELRQIIRETIAVELPKALRAICKPVAAPPQQRRRNVAESPS